MLKARLILGFLIFCKIGIISANHYSPTNNVAFDSDTLGSTTSLITAEVLPHLPQPQETVAGSVAWAKREELEGEVDRILSQLSPQEESILDRRLKEQQQTQRNPFIITLYRPNYILPYYYTGDPYTEVYRGNTPENQPVLNEEFKAQLSLELPIFTSLFRNPNLSLDTAYTQLMYWQFYASSQYFRETNYEPEAFVEYHFHSNWLLRGGFDHDSNGRGGDLERSWNRAFGEVQVSGGNWLIGVRGWGLVFPDVSSNLHNPDIAHYLGYENLLIAYDFHDLVLTVQLQNIESGLQRGFEQFTVSYPTLKHISLYAQYFMGYGQSLIEYDHRTRSFGIGIAFNDWI